MMQQRFPAALARVVDRYHDSFRWLADDHVPAIMGDVGLSLKARTFEGAHDPLVKHGIKRQRRLRRVRGPAERGCKTGVFTRAQKIGYYAGTAFRRFCHRCSRSSSQHLGAERRVNKG